MILIINQAQFIKQNNNKGIFGEVTCNVNEEYIEVASENDRRRNSLDYSVRR